ncbi:MAG: hypothetical protein U5R31_03535 [Acidimicrobiia bacterium]|nr:hypothetical protein [Acidimicrobiia bacterium]
MAVGLLLPRRRVGAPRRRTRRDRAVGRFATTAADGFVPHIDYHGDRVHDAFWARGGASAITQPPMYGHAVAEVVALGFEVDDGTVERAVRGLRHLLTVRPRHPSGLVRIVHPWESGADDSPRWDHWCEGGWSPRTWYRTKGQLVASIERGPTGSPLMNLDFDVAPAGFNALVAFNAHELGGSPATSASSPRPTSWRSASTPLGRGARDLRSTWEVVDGVRPCPGARRAPRCARDPLAPIGRRGPCRQLATTPRTAARVVRPACTATSRHSPPGPTGVGRPGRSSPTCCGSRPGGAATPTRPGTSPVAPRSGSDARDSRSTGTPTPARARGDPPELGRARRPDGGRVDGRGTLSVRTA